MNARELTQADKTAYNRLVCHPLQSWEWGQFREKTGVTVVRIGLFNKNKLVSGYQLTLHPIPFSSYTVGYLPKGGEITEELIESLTSVCNKLNCIFIRLEPNLLSPFPFPLCSNLVAAYREQFTKYTFYLDLTQTEEQLLKNMHPKTRYNIKVAQKHGVTIQEENTEEAFTAYLALTAETTKRQGFYAHNYEYHRKMWETLRQDSGQALPTAHLFTARYQGKILTTWILFLVNNVLYYPYGASTQHHREVMASTLMMWETMRWGKMHGAKTYDLWGTPGPDPKPTDAYFGFHRFKMGFGPKLIEFVGSYDLVLKQPHYTLLKRIDLLRWSLLKFRTRL